MTKGTLHAQIVADLGVNYKNEDSEVLGALLDDVISDALSMSNRKHKKDKEAQIDILSSNIKKAVKTIYLQRGIEDVKSQSQSGLSNTYDNAMETMLSDIIRQNKRVLM